MFACFKKKNDFFIAIKILNKCILSAIACCSFLASNALYELKTSTLLHS